METREGGLSVSMIEGKGRGLFAQQVFEPGDIILSQPALAIIFSDPSSSLSSPFLNKVKKFRHLKETLSQRATADGAFREILFSLHAGPRLGFISSEVLSTKLPETISMQRIEGILLVNGFQGTSDGESGTGPFGLWHLPSFINHDCSKLNSHWAIIKDFLTVRAAKHIEIGEEILISYIDPDQPSYVRNELFLKHDFLCGCRLCSIEKHEENDVILKRDTILDEFTVKVLSINGGTESPDPEYFCEVISELKAMRATLCENPFVFQPLMQLGLGLLESGKYEKTLSTFEEAHQVCKAFVQFHSAGVVLSIASLKSCFKLQDDDSTINQQGLLLLTKKWVKRLRQWTRIQYGKGDTIGVLKTRHANSFREVERLVQTHLGE